MSNVFYMPAPDLNGDWAAQDALPEYKEDASIFKFTVAADGKTAAFEVCDDVAACRQALGGLRRGWMMVVCEAAEFAPASTKAIKTAKTGSAELHADGAKIAWKVTDKAAIEFIEGGAAAAPAPAPAGAAPSAGSKVFYMPAPELTGVWAAAHASDEYKEGESIFKFTVSADGKTATFAICNDTAACRAALAGLRRGWMMVVCEAGMFAPASTKAINTNTEGVTDLQADGGWKLKSKAVIEYVEEGGKASMPAPTAIPAMTASSKIFYMPAPDLNGVWAADGAKPVYNEEASVFKFAEAVDEKSAVFSVCEDTAACRLALGGLRRGWMMIVCEAAEFAPASTKAIKTVRMGAADKQADGGWKIREKAAIEFIE
ncbi:MAG: hypothetical protein FWB85_03870 [Chitinispirillia bacterium]|nr:hypothetical protein [Chitinispirillia bacterium]MCL2241513.1 hypothetical protein [Chitinispirillia bacterium]